LKYYFCSSRVSSRRNLRPTNGSSTLPASSTNHISSYNKNSNLKTVLFLSSSSVSISKSDKLANNTRSPPPPKPPRQPFPSSKNSSINNNALIEANEYKPKNATLPRKNDYRNR
jgi:hypothetical protein